MPSPLQVFKLQHLITTVCPASWLSFPLNQLGIKMDSNALPQALIWKGKWHALNVDRKWSISKLNTSVFN